MKKIIVTVLLMLSLISASLGEGLWKLQWNSSVIASAAADSISNQRPNLKAVKRTATTATLSYSKIEAAKGYKIYRSSQFDGKYEYVGSSKSLAFTDKGLQYHESYYYKVRAYANAGEKKIHSKYSSAVSFRAAFGKVILKAGESKENAISLSWERISGADQYKVYRSDTKNGSYKYIGTSRSTAFTDNNLGDSRSYYYRVRAYKKIDGVKYNGVYSDQIKGTALAAAQDELASRVLALVNKERAGAGLNELSMPKALTAPANKRAEEIKESFSHTRPDGRSWSTVLEDYDISIKAAGENLAFGYNTPEEVVKAWMNSPGHKANILNSSYNKVGIGVYTKDGTIYWTQLFSS